MSADADDVLDQVLVPPIYRGRDPVIDLTPPAGTTYGDLGSSTLRFAVGRTAESPDLEVTTTATAAGQVTVPGGDTVRVKLERAGTALLSAGQNRWGLSELIGDDWEEVAAGVVEVRKGAGSLPA